MKNVTTRIVASGRPDAPFRWSVENEHDRMLLAFFGTQAECDKIDAEFKKSGVSAWGATQTVKDRTFFSNGVIVARKHLGSTPCLLCGDPPNAEAAGVPFGCKLGL